MKVKTVCASIAVATSMTTGIIFVPPAQVVAQNSPNQIERANSRVSRSLEIQWLLGFIPWPIIVNNSNSSSSQNLRNRTTYANNPNNSKPTNIGSSNRSKSLGAKQEQNHKPVPVPVPVLIPGLAALGANLIRKHRKEQKQMEMK